MGSLASEISRVALRNPASVSWLGSGSGAAFGAVGDDGPWTAA